MKKKKIFLLSFMILAIISFAFVYRNKNNSINKEFDIIVDKDISNKVSLYIDNELADSIPEGNIYLLNNYESFCLNGEDVYWDYATKTLSISPITKKTSCVVYLNSVYRDETLNGNDPVLSKGMLPVVFNSEGRPVYVSLNDEWYKYSIGKWANIVILNDNVSQVYNVGDVIQEFDIKGYFVWIPRFDYKIFDLGLYKELTDRTNKTNIIKVRFSDSISTDGKDSCHYTSNTCEVDKWVTHSAFANSNIKGFWVGKYQNKIDSDTLKVDTLNQIYLSDFTNLFNSSYNFRRTDDSHMIKNTEWGAIAYLTYSDFGSNENNSTTANVTGVYDLNNEYGEFVAAYADNSEKINILDSLSSINSKYFDVYEGNSVNDYSKRIFGDALGEMGPFNNEYISSFGNSHIEMPNNDLPFISRGKSNMFSSYSVSGVSDELTTSRVVLFVK